MSRRYNKRKNIPSKRKGPMIDLNKLVQGFSRTSVDDRADQTDNQKREKDNKMLHSELSIWNGVKLSCVQGRWYHVNFDRKSVVVSYGEYKEDGNFIYQVPEESVSVDLPSCFNAKSARKPVCIGSFFPYLIIQYQSPQVSEYTRFLFLDLKKRHAQVFEDAVQYLQSNFITKGVVECLLSPNMTYALFLLPMHIKSDRKWSKLLCSKISLNDHKIDDIREYGLQDRRNQAVAIYPNDGTKILFVIVDSYCSFCKVRTQNFEAKSMTEVKVSLRPRSESFTDESCSEDADGEEPDHYYLLQCSADFCRSGEVIVLTCLVQKAISNACRYLVKVFQLCTFRKVLINISTVRVPRHLKHRIVNIDSVVPFFSRCDVYLKVWFMKNQEMSVASLHQVPLVKTNTLKSFCRAVILRALKSTKGLQELTNILPIPLINFLNFELI